MNAVFIDSSFWITLRDRTETQHSRARHLGGELASQRAPLVSTTFVFAEIYAYFCRSRRLREQVISDFWERGVIRLIDPIHSEQQAALEILRQCVDKDYSFCDAVSFVVMKNQEVFRVASFDDHFRQFGEFEVIS
ncbi:MAG: type II toxin-antitoxin system VapC family toxin [Verrucomicrobia bacterium]|nr:type II toxin-antitoxin system VapC family toxin [Verrucomicrobiota bacterium]